MKNPTLNFISWVAVCVLFFSAWIFWPDKLDTGIVVESESNDIRIPDYLIKKLRYVSVREDKRELELFADTATFFLEQEIIYSNNPISYFYNEKGEKTRLTGEKGVYWMKDRKLQVNNNVKTLSADGFSIDGNQVDYYLDKKFLESKLPVFGETEKKDLKIWANSANTKTETAKVFFNGNVRTEHLSPKKELTKIRGDQAELERNENKITYFNNVFIQQPKMELHSEEASLWYGEENTKRVMKYMIAKRDVQINETEERFSQSQMAEFLNDSNTVILTGFPSVFDGKDAVTGDKLTLYRNTGVIEVNAANAAFSQTERKRKKNNKAEVVNKEDFELVVEEPKKK